MSQFRETIQQQHEISINSDSSNNLAPPTPPPISQDSQEMKQHQQQQQLQLSSNSRQSLMPRHSAFKVHRKGKGSHYHQQLTAKNLSLGMQNSSGHHHLHLPTVSGHQRRLHNKQQLDQQRQDNNNNSNNQTGLKKGLSFSIDSIIGGQQCEQSNVSDIHLINRHIEQCQRNMAYQQQQTAVNQDTQFPIGSSANITTGINTHLLLQQQLQLHLQQQQQQTRLRHQQNNMKQNNLPVSQLLSSSRLPQKEPSNNAQLNVNGQSNNNVPPTIPQAVNLPNIINSNGNSSNFNQLFPWFMALPQVAQFLCDQQQLVNKQEGFANSMRSLNLQQTASSMKNPHISSPRSSNHHSMQDSNTSTSNQNLAPNSKRLDHQHRQQQQQTTPKCFPGKAQPDQEHNINRHRSPIYDEMKPAHSYIGLIAMCILSTPDKRMVLNDIYQFILDNYAYFRNRGNGWRNSIRHNLSLNQCFKKCGRAANGKGHFWTIHPANMEDFMRGDFRRRRAQRKVRRHEGLHVPSDESDDQSDDPSKPPLPEHFKRSLIYHHRFETQQQHARSMLQSVSGNGFQLQPNRAYNVGNCSNEQKVDDATSTRNLHNFSPMTSLVSLSKSLSPTHQSPLNLISNSPLTHNINEIDQLEDWNSSNQFSMNIPRSNNNFDDDDCMSDKSDDCDTEINVASPIIPSVRSSRKNSPFSPISVSSPVVMDTQTDNQQSASRI